MSPIKCVCCLYKTINPCVPNGCKIHKYCYECLLKWSQEKWECPLCREPFTSIILEPESSNGQQVMKPEPSVSADEEFATETSANSQEFSSQDSDDSSVLSTQTQDLIENIEINDLLINTAASITQLMTVHNILNF